MNKNIFYTSNGNINKFKNTKSLFSNFDRPKNIPIIVKKKEGKRNKKLKK